MRVDQRTKEIARLMRERSEFFAALSHELRTPVAVVMGKADMMLDSTFRKSDRWTKETGRTLKASGAQLSALIDDILELAKAESKGLELRLEDVQLTETLRSMRPTLDGLARAGRLQLTLDVPESIPAVLADRARLNEIILNLVDNAVKYTPPGGRIGMSASASNGRVEVSVSDTGVGIPKQEGKRIFDAFYRVKGTDTQRGLPSSGLGLALVKQLVEAHGGRIDFTSVENEGSTFTFDLPAARSGNRERSKRGRRRSASSVSRR
jgi:signal transduction histidine kinase